MYKQQREKRLEDNWRLFRMTSMIAAGVLLVVLLTVDFMFAFSSIQLNVTIALIAIALFALFKLDFWLHQLSRLNRKRRREQHPHL